MAHKNISREKFSLGHHLQNSMILACFSATTRFWYSNDKNSLPQVEDRPNATEISWFGLKSFHSLNAGAYPTADQNISLLTSLTSYFQKPLKIRKNGFEIRVKNDQRQTEWSRLCVAFQRINGFEAVYAAGALGGVHMYAHTSSAHVIRTRHPLPSSARGVHMCTRPSSVKYVEYRISFVSVCCFVSLLLR